MMQQQQMLQQIRNFIHFHIHSKCCYSNVPESANAYIEPAHHHQARIKTLTKTLAALYGQRAKKNAELLTQRRSFLNDLHAALCHTKSKLILVGSLANGLGMDINSDIDVCLFTQDQKFLNDFRCDLIKRR